MKTKKQFTKVVCSISEMADALDLSRARFYQLLRTGIFPQPIYDIRTKRPYYNLELQEKCQEVKQTGVGCNGQYILFYSPRKKNNNGTRKTTPKKISKYQDITETLITMGLDVSSKDVETAVNSLYPQGIGDSDQGVVIREIFRFFKQKTV